MTESEREFWKRKWAQGQAVRRRGWGCGPGFGTDRYGGYGGGKGRGKEKRGRWLWLMIAAGFLAVMILGIIPDEVWGSQGRGQETQAERRMTLGRGQRFQVWETAGRTQEQTDQAGEQPARSGEQESKAWGEPAQPEDGVEIFGLDDFDFSDVNRFLQKENGEPSLTMEGVMADLMEGDLGGLCRRMANALKQSLFSEISIGSRLIGQVLALGLVGAVFTNFSTVFQGSEISETGFFITYLLLFTFLAASMMESMALTAGVVEDVLEFMGILMPSYFLAVAFAGGSVSAVVMYEFTLWVMAVGQWLLGTLILPLVKIYVLLAMAGNLVKEEFLSRLTGLLGQAAGWGLKTLPGLVLGFHLIQGLILPYVDSLKQGAVEKAVSMIPGIGQGASAVTKMLVGSGVLIKNTIGAAAMVILMVLIAMPVIKLLVLLVMYQCVAAVMEPVCDRRLVNCVMAAAKGQKMMVQVVASTALILVITVAVVCAGTNATYFA